MKVFPFTCHHCWDWLRVRRFPGSFYPDKLLPGSRAELEKGWRLQRRRGRRRRPVNRGPVLPETLLLKSVKSLLQPPLAGGACPSPAALLAVSTTADVLSITVAWDRVVLLSVVVWLVRLTWEVGTARGSAGGRWGNGRRESANQGGTCISV